MSYLLTDQNRYQFNSKADARNAINLAIGRIFRMGGRPTQEGDIEMYQKCKHVIMDAAEFLGVEHNCTF